MATDKIAELHHNYVLSDDNYTIVVCNSRWFKLSQDTEFTLAKTIDDIFYKVKYDETKDLFCWSQSIDIGNNICCYNKGCSDNLEEACDYVIKLIPQTIVAEYNDLNFTWYSESDNNINKWISNIEGDEAIVIEPNKYDKDKYYWRRNWKYGADIFKYFPNDFFYGYAYTLDSAIIDAIASPNIFMSKCAALIASINEYPEGNV